ncbi:MAG: hypothetical protein R3254_11740, partial [Thiomicrorhabdus sp.]|nr:hypothetical protein [Thiomicrorhabdus sp.]
MPKRKNLIHLLALTPILFIPAVVLFVGSLVVSVEQDLYEHARVQIQQDFLETEKSRVRSKVQNMVNLVSYRQSIINQRLHDRIQRRVEDA